MSNSNPNIFTGLFDTTHTHESINMISLNPWAFSKMKNHKEYIKNTSFFGINTGLDKSRLTVVSMQNSVFLYYLLTILFSI